MKWVVEYPNSIIHSATLAVHVDKTGDANRGVEEVVDEHVGVDLLAFAEILVFGT